MFQHGSVATDKTRNVQFEPAMNQNSTTLQLDLSTSNSPSLPPCVYKCAFMRSCQCGSLLASSYKMDITGESFCCCASTLSRTWHRFSTSVPSWILPTRLHASPSVPSCVPADVDCCLRESDERLLAFTLLKNRTFAPRVISTPPCVSKSLHAFLSMCTSIDCCFRPFASVHAPWIAASVPSDSWVHG